MADVRGQSEQTHGNIAHGSTDAGNPIKIGGKTTAIGSAPTAVTTGQRSDAWFDTLGRLVNLPYTSTPLTAYVALTTTSASTLVAAPGSGSIYVTSLHGSNSSGTLTTVTFKEGASGTAKFTFSMAASGGGFTVNLNVPWKIAATTLLEVVQSAAMNSYITVTYFVAP